MADGRRSEYASHVHHLLDANCVGCWPGFILYLHFAHIEVSNFLLEIAPIPANSTQSSSMMAPALPQIAVHYGISSPTILNMTLSIFLLAYATGPLFLSPLTEVWGRKWVCSPMHIALFDGS